MYNNRFFKPNFRREYTREQGIDLIDQVEEAVKREELENSNKMRRPGKSNSGVD